MSARIVLVAMFILAFASAATAQTQTTRPPLRPPETRTPAEDQENSRLPDDMRIKMAIARAEEDHKKVLEDVEKLSDLSSEIAHAYDERKSLSSDDMKKLGTMEKLAKRILTHAGGEEVDSKSDSTENLVMEQAIDMLSTTVANIKKEMSGETRFVVSATVIANSNEVINLSRFIRRAKKTE
jgi:hypothetical protein